MFYKCKGYREKRSSLNCPKKLTVKRARWAIGLIVPRHPVDKWWSFKILFLPVVYARGLCVTRSLSERSRLPAAKINDVRIRVDIGRLIHVRPAAYLPGGKGQEARSVHASWPSRHFPPSRRQPATISCSCNSTCPPTSRIG